MRGLFCRLAIFFLRVKNFFTLYLFYDRNEKFTTMEKYQLPPLPYSDSDLYPVISAETITFHYGKHTQGYIDKHNSLIAGTSYETLPLEDIIKTSDGALFNNAAQAWNHLFYFASFSPTAPHAPKGKLAAAIDKQWGSFASFQELFEAEAVALFGSGWVWLCADNNGGLAILPESNAGTPLLRGLVPLLAFDVWEHAYYIDYRNRRAEHVNRLWDIVDWTVVENRYF